MKKLMTLLVFLLPIITARTQVKNWELKLLEKTTANFFSHSTGLSSGKIIASEQNEFLIIKVQLTNKKEIDSTITVEEVFVKDKLANKRYNLKAISFGQAASAFMFPLLKQGKVMQTAKGGSYEIGRDNENEAMQIKIFNKVSECYLYFEIPKVVKRNFQLYFGGSRISII